MGEFTIVSLVEGVTIGGMAELDSVVDAYRVLKSASKNGFAVMTYNGIVSYQLKSGTPKPIFDSKAYHVYVHAPSIELLVFTALVPFGYDLSEFAHAVSDVSEFLESKIGFGAVRAAGFDEGLSRF